MLTLEGRTRLLVTIIMLGALLRVAAFYYNDLPHGDVQTDYTAAWSFYTDGRLFTLFGINHPPLWPFLGGIGAYLFGDPFLAFKVFSLLAGILLVPLSFWAFRRPFGEEAALLASTFIAFSYLLSDYSGNGSLYALQALLYLLLIALCAKLDRWRNSLLLGLVAGLAYLLNYQAVIVFVALIAVYLVDHSLGKRSWRKLPVLLLSLGCAFAVVLPLLIRNTITFGSPFYNTNINYIFQKLNEFSYLSIPEAVLFWTARNIGYMSVRLSILAPFVSFFAPFALLHDIRHKHKRPEAATWAVSALFILHIAISCLWPVFKFRYFVPLMPLLCGLGAHGIFTFLKSTWTRSAVIALTLGSFVGVGVLTYIRVPSHTNYYDSNELYHWRTGEADWQIQERLFRDAVLALDDQPPGAVMSSRAADYYTHRPLVAMTPQDKALVRFHIEKYDLRYIVDEIEKEAFYQSFLPCKVLYRNTGFSTLHIIDSP